MFLRTDYKMRLAMRQWLIVLLMAATMQSTGHVFVHLTDNQLATHAVTQLAPPQSDDTTNQIFGSTSHSCTGCESLLKHHNLIPVSLAFALTEPVLAYGWQRSVFVAAPALALHSSRAPPQA